MADTFADLSPTALNIVQTTALQEATRQGSNDPEDVAQQVLEQYLGCYTQVSNPGAWARVVANRRVIDERRAQHVPGADVLRNNHDFDLRHIKAAATTSQDVPARNSLDIAFATLNERQQQILTLAAHGYSGEALATALGVADAHVANVLVARARAALREAFPAGPERDALYEHPRLY